MNYLSPILSHSRGRAERQALRLIAYSSAILPDLEGKVGELIIEDVVETGVSFATNARRCLENSNENPVISDRRFDYEIDPSVQLECNLKRALNGMIHARSLRLHHVTAPSGVFQNHSNGLLLHFVYETDRYPETYVDIFGMCWAFISQPSKERTH